MKKSSTRRPPTNDYFDSRPRTGNMSPQDRDRRDDYCPRSPVSYDRRARSPPRGPALDRPSFDRRNSDRGSWSRREPRDRSISPGRNRVGRQPTSAQWQGRERDSDIHPGDVYRPVYDPSTLSPARLGSASNKHIDSRSPTVTHSHPNISHVPDNAKGPSIDPIATTKVLEAFSTKAPVADPNQIVKDVITNPAPPTTNSELGIETMDTQQHQLDPAMSLGEFLHSLIGEATDFAALKTQKIAAEKDFNRRDAEFKKSKANHEKFPVTEEAQRRNKDLAQKALNSVTEKFEQKSSILKGMALQGATKLLLSGIGNERRDQKAQEQIDSLEKRCMDLETQVADQKSFIDCQRSEREALEKNHRELQNDIAVTKNQQEEFQKKVQPQVDEALQNGPNYKNELESLKKATTEDISLLRAKVPDISGILSRLDKLEDLNHTKVKEDHISVALSKTITEYGQKLETLTGHVSKLAQNQSDFREKLIKTHSDVGLLTEKVTTIESRGQDMMVIDGLRTELNNSREIWRALETKVHSIPSHVDLKNLRERVEGTEIELNNSNRRLYAMENQARPDRLTSMPAGPLKRDELVELEKTLSALEKSSASSAITPAPGFDYESLKTEILAVVQKTQEASDEFIGSQIDILKAAIEEQKNLYVPLSELPKKFADLSKFSTDNNQAHNSVLRQTDEKYNTWIMSQQAVQQNQDERIEAATHGVINIEKRLNLINTKDLAHSMLSQMDSSYPHLRDAQNILSAHKTELEQNQIRFFDIDRTIKDVFFHIKTVESRVQEIVPADTTITEVLRREVDEVNQHITTVKKLAMEAKDKVDELSQHITTAKQLATEAKDGVDELSQHITTAKQLATEAKDGVDELSQHITTAKQLATEAKDQVDELSQHTTTAKQLATEAKDGVDAISKKREEEATTIGTGFVHVHKQLDELETQQKVLSKAIFTSPATKSSSSHAVENPDRSFPDRSSSNGNSVRAHSKFDSSTSRQSSGEPLSKKRRPNGIAPTAKMNGIHSGSFGKKRKHQGVIEVHDSEDDNFEPAQPTISDDDDD